MPTVGGPTTSPSLPVRFVTNFPTTQWATAQSFPPASFPTPETQTQVVLTPSPNAQASPTLRPTAPVVPPTPKPTALPPTFSPTINPTWRPTTPAPFPQSPFPTTGQPINANAANSNSNSNIGGGGALPVGALVGIVVGCLLLAGVVLYILFVKNGEGGRRQPVGDLHTFYGGGDRHSGGGIDMRSNGAPGFTPYLNEPPRRNSRGSRGSFGSPPAKRDSIPGLTEEDARRSSLTRGMGPHSFEGGMPGRESLSGPPRRPSYSAGNRLSTETRQSLEQVKPRGLSFTGRDSIGGAPRRDSFTSPQAKRPSYAL